MRTPGTAWAGDEEDGDGLGAFVRDTEGVWWIAISAEAGEGARYRLRASW